MPLASQKIITRNWGTPNSWTLDAYRKGGGYKTLEKVLGMQPAQVIDEVKKSNLRGRGGAGFPTGMKWSFVPKDSPKPKYLAVNADESEPGTFKDRYILEHDPHMMLEGIAIASFGIGVHTAYVYVRGEFRFQADRLEKAIDEAYRAGVRELIESQDFGQGMPAGRKVKAVIPGGSSAPVMTPDELDTALEFEALKQIQNMAGSGGVIVMDDATCLVRCLWRISRFYAEESCGQCTPCREGTPWMTRVLRKIEEGRGEPGDIETLLNVAQSIAPFPPMGLGQTICALGDAAALPVHSFVVKFRDEFEEHIRLGKCPYGDKPWGHYGGMIA